MFGDFIQKTLGVKQILPVTTVGNSTVKGVGYDRTGYLSAAIVYAAGICPSVPTGFTVVLKVQDSTEDVDGSYTDFATIATFGTASDLSAASVVKYFDVNLRGAKQWVRVTELLTFTGGASPSQIGSVCLVLGDKNVEAVDSTSVVYGS